MIRLLLASLLMGAAGVSLPGVACAQLVEGAVERAVVRLLPLGRVPAAELDAVVTALEAALPVRVVRMPPQPLPKVAWYAPRRRYRADILLDWLAPQAGKGERILAVTAVDISTTKDSHRDWGVFGLAHLGGPSAVISRLRLARKIPKTAAGRALVRRRVTTTAVHEVGHTLGLDHCSEAQCVMLDAQGGIANTDSSTGRPGPICAAKLRARQNSPQP